jgi:hypothetical protein
MWRSSIPVAAVEAASTHATEESDFISLTMPVRTESYVLYGTTRFSAGTDAVQLRTFGVASALWISSDEDARA